jgi:hypothetical protein
MITQRQQWQRDLAADARGLRNARLERLRTAYATLIEAASTFQAIALYRSATYEGQGTKWGTEWLKLNETHIQRFEEALEPAIEAGRKAQVTLMLESGFKMAEEVHSEYLKARSALPELELAIHQAAEKRNRKLPDTANIISNAIQNLQKAARTHLAELEKPI